MNSIIIGTAGHIDHGKTLLIKQLTGIDTDRLQEEQERGVTIDLGFAFLNKYISFIDVPGHERFVKNMVTGVSSIDYVMLVIAADDGVMVQTKEHFEILRLLGVELGIIVLSKIDLVDRDWLELVKEDIRNLVEGSFLEESQIFQVSSKTGEGIKELKDFLLTLPDTITTQSENKPFRMPIDRVFSMKGYGTVVTGTVISGLCTINEKVILFPQNIPLKIRGMQCHGNDVVKVGKSDRAAINLQSLEKSVIKRGNFLGSSEVFYPTKIITCSLRLIDNSKPLSYNSKVRIHLGTGEYIARVRIIGLDFIESGLDSIVQLIFEEDICVGFKDRFIIRRLSPVTTIGGGIVLDVSPKILRKKEIESAKILQNLLGLNLKESVFYYFNINPNRFINLQEFSQKFSVFPSEIELILQKDYSKEIILSLDKCFMLKSDFKKIEMNIIEFLYKSHEKNSDILGFIEIDVISYLGLDMDTGIKILSYLDKKKIVKRFKGKVALFDFQVKLSSEQNNIIAIIERELLMSAYKPPDYKQLKEKVNLDEDEFNKLIIIMRERDILQILEGKIMFHQSLIDKGQDQLTEFFNVNENGSVSELKELFQTSRKYIIPLLNYYDSIGLTRRDGDKRRLNI